MTANDIDQMSCEELESLIMLLVMKYGLMVKADFSDIKYWVDAFYTQQMQLEEAVEALKRENNE